jgi:hypothetical protein
MNSITIGRYKSTNAENPKGGYQKPSIAIARTLGHGNGHYVRPNNVAIKYFDF